MSSLAKLCKSNERGMKDCDEQWRGKSEIQSTWENINCILYIVNQETSLEQKYMNMLVL